VLRAVLWPRAPRAVAAALYLLLGWAIVAYWPEVRAALAPGSHAFLIAGGALYSLDAIVYALRRPDPSPRVFGYHEVFHALVIAGCGCHFIAVFELIQRA
jgi:hemolysin III